MKLLYHLVIKYSCVHIHKIERKELIYHKATLLDDLMCKTHILKLYYLVPDELYEYIRDRKTNPGRKKEAKKSKKSSEIEHLCKNHETINTFSYKMF